MKIKPTTTADELARRWGITLDALRERLGPLPDPKAHVPRGLGQRIVEVLEGRRRPMRGSLLVRAVRKDERFSGYARQSIYSTAAKMTERGLLRRPRHGFYEVAR